MKLALASVVLLGLGLALGLMLGSPVLGLVLFVTGGAGLVLSHWREG